ncbi:MAG: hypothetical protein KJ737_22310 [Proteobacteria bacterium]|nr:hypothetical protein [Pseudomonadota bacterium]
MTTTARCPGNELNKSVQTLSCKCPSCGKENEIFSDELNKKHTCTACGKKLDTSACHLDGKA